MYRNINILKAGGVELRGMKASLAPRRQQTQASPKLEQYTFIPYDNITQSKVGVHCISSVIRCLPVEKYI
jgi:fatty acid synthase